MIASPTVPRVGAILLVSLFAAVSLWSCGSETSPEAQIERLLERLEQAVETRAVRDAADLLADSYRDDYHVSKAAAARALFAYTRSQRALHLFTLLDRIDLSKDQSSAAAVVHVAVTRVPVESVDTLLSLNADLYRFDVELIDSDGEWRVATAKWRRVGTDWLR